MNRALANLGWVIAVLLALVVGLKWNQTGSEQTGHDPGTAKGVPPVVEFSEQVSAGGDEGEMISQLSSDLSQAVLQPDASEEPFLTSRKQALQTLETLKRDFKEGTGKELQDSAQRLMSLQSDAQFGARATQLVRSLQRLQKSRVAAEGRAWKEEVDAITREAEEFFETDGVSAAEAEALLARVNEVQANRPGSTHNYGTLAHEKLQATVDTLTKWLKHLRSAEKGFEEDALEILEALEARQSQYVLVSRERIEEVIVGLAGSQADRETLLLRHDEEWIKKVEAFVEEVEKTCNQDEVDSLDVEALLMRATGLELHQSSNRNSRMELTKSKLEECSATLSTWLRYQRALERGYYREALSRLESLRSSRNGFPILSLERVEALIVKLKERDEPEERGVISVNRILSGVEKADRSALIDAIKSVEEFSGKSRDIDTSAILGALQSFHDALELLEAGEVDEAHRKAVFRSRSRYDGLEEGQERIRDLVLMEVLPARFGQGKAGGVKPEDTPRTYVARLLGEELEGSEPEERRFLLLIAYARLLKLADVPEPDWLETDLRYHRYYVNGTRMEKAGDLVGALRSYRQALAGEAGRFALDESVAARVGDLKKDHPRLFEPTTDAVMEELEKLQSMMRSFLAQQQRNSRYPIRP